jgi:hypothetical protein
MREGGEKSAVRKMDGFTDGGHHLVGVIRKICGFTDMEISGIQKSGVQESRIPRVQESNQLI